MNEISDITLADRYYQALLDKDPAFQGIFYVGVRTTSVFCISTCRARKPHRKNVLFYKSAKDALAGGYRPCKICRPTEEGAPEEIRELIEEVRVSPAERITDTTLRERGISPERVRRWFNQHHGMTFQAYQRMNRINLAYQELNNGASATQAAFDSGYNSLSSFGYAYKHLVGAAPKEHSEVIVLSRVDTPLGPMFAAATKRGLCLLEFTDRKMLETEFGDLQQRLKARIIVGENEHTRAVRKQLGEYFEGSRTTFDIELEHPGTEFQQKVWRTLLGIPHGFTTSYKEMAMRMGQPTATRAIATANGMNRIAIVIPCHRVIGADGKLRGYAGGIERKAWLLRHEGAMI